MKRYIINILLIVAAVLVSDFSWGITIAGGTMSGNLTLTDNTYLTTPITVSGTLTIDLNGYVLAPSGGNEYVIKVPYGTKLIIKDSQPTLGHAGYLDNNGLFRWPKGDNPQHAMPGGIIYNPYKDEATERKGILVEGICEIQGGKIAGCFTTGIGAAVTCSSSGTFTMTGGEILYNRSNKSTGVSGVIYGEATNNNNGSRINLTNVKLSHNKTEGRGGAICGYHVTLNKCSLLNNSAGMEGGAIYVRNSGTLGSLNIESCIIQYNASGSTGGGICVDNATPCLINNSDISYNYAAAFGGGIYSSGSTTITNSTIKGNWAMSTETGLNDKGNGVINKGRGGGFCFSGNSTKDEAKAVEFVLDNTLVTENTSMYYGGGGQLQSSGKLTIQNNTKIYKNTCVLKGAAGLHLTGEVFFYMKETSEISENVALGGVGGGIHSSYECTLHLDGGTISKNIVYGRGGGVHINTGGDIVLNGTNITDNKAYDGFNLISSTVTKDADGKYTWSDPERQQDYPMPGYGGGLLINSGSCTMNKGELSGNYAQTLGGGIGMIMTTSGEFAHHVRLASFTLNSGNVIGNTTDGNGGGIYLMENILQNLSESEKNKYTHLVQSGDWTPKITLNGGTISNNVAAINGGGAYQEQKTAFMVSANKSTTLSGNKAGQSGGAVYIAKGNFTVNGTASILSNQAVAGDGGAIYLGEGNQSIPSVFTVGNNGQLILGGDASAARNFAGGNGGGVYCGGSFLVNGLTTIIGNASNKNGGALYVTGTGASITLNDCTISKNMAKECGGAFYVSNGSIVLNGAATISENIALIKGGAAYVDNGSVSTAEGNEKTIISYNKVDQDAADPSGQIYYSGGAFFIKGANATNKGFLKLRGETEIIGNTTYHNGGAIALDNGDVIISGAKTTMSDNKALNGGAVYVYKGNFNANNTNANIILEGNSARGNGGAVNVYEGNINISGISSASITNNYSSKEGGAFYVDGGNIELCKTELSGNGKYGAEIKTTNGGAIALYNGVFTFADGSEIKNNAAKGNGGALYVMNNTQNNSSIRCTGGSYLNNSAGLGGGIYASGPINLSFAANVRDNKALNGGGLYIDGGVDMSFGNGLIVGNSARYDANTVADGTQYGVGGGIYLASGSLTFTATQNLGIYNNSASYEAADIFASGSSTEVNLPNISGMNLTGFEVPGSDLYWVKDYSNKRYETALRNNEDIEQLILTFDKGVSEMTLTDRQCLDLGYDLVFVKLIISGLDDSDNAAVTIAYPKNDNAVVYRKIVLTGSKQQIVGLPSNHWQFVATPWSSFKYSDPTYTPEHSKTDDSDENLKSGYIYIKRNVNQEIKVSFQKKASVSGNKTFSFDAIKVNKMRPGGTM